MAKSMVIARRRVAAGGASHFDEGLAPSRRKSPAPADARAAAPPKSTKAAKPDSKSKRETPKPRARMGKAKSDSSVKLAPGVVLPCGDPMVRLRTGRGWDEWFRLFDAAGVAGRKPSHGEVWQAALDLDPKLDGWWAQMVSVGYERARGLRAMNQSCNGEFQASVSRTLPVPMDRAFLAWSKSSKRWLDAPGLAFTKINPGKNIRARWPDGAMIDIRFTAKGADKVQIVADTTKLDSTQAVAAAKALWQEQFARLSEFLGI